MQAARGTRRARGNFSEIRQEWSALSALSPDPSLGIELCEWLLVSGRFQPTTALCDPSRLAAEPNERYKRSWKGGLTRIWRGRRDRLWSWCLWVWGNCSAAEHYGLGDRGHRIVLYVLRDVNGFDSLYASVDCLSNQKGFGWSDKTRTPLCTKAKSMRPCNLSIYCCCVTRKSPLSARVCMYGWNARLRHHAA